MDTEMQKCIEVAAAAYSLIALRPSAVWNEQREDGRWTKI
jgi:hypothetical protein